jgi:predicted phage-related endonuclease
MNINDIIREYIRTKEQKAAAEKKEAELKALILEHAAGTDFFATEDFNVIIKKTVSTRLDSKALYKDFPDIKKEYGKDSVSYSIIPAKNDSAMPEEDSEPVKKSA